MSSARIIAKSQYLAPRPLPSWARLTAEHSQGFDANFAAGGALSALDAWVRFDPPWMGAFKQRLALRAAAAALRLIGRREDEEQLRDIWRLGRTESDWGPSGMILRAWLRLGERHTELTPEYLREAAQSFGIDLSDGETEILKLFEATVNSKLSPLQSAAAIAREVTRLNVKAELLGLWLADLALARHLNWAKPMPLLITQLVHPAVRGDSRRAVRSSDIEWPRTVALGYAHAAAVACDLAADISRAVEVLNEAAPKLRAPGAGQVVRAFLEHDSLSCATRINKISDRGMRRLCDRLVELGAVRELTGRSTFRLYGL
jgi:hypothetical protein